jgi:hypothetical protein
MNLHVRNLHQFDLFDIRFLLFLVDKPLNFPKLKKIMI